MKHFLEVMSIGFACVILICITIPVMFYTANLIDFHNFSGQPSIIEVSKFGVLLLTWLTFFMIGMLGFMKLLERIFD